MKAPTVFALTLLVLFTFSACGGSSEGDSVGGDPEVARTVNDPCPSLEGAWELKKIDDEAPALEGSDTDPVYAFGPMLKILTGKHWMFIRQIGDSLIHAQGGRYTLESGGFYTEYVNYSVLPSNIGKNFKFTCKIEGDSLWYHIGGLGGDERYNEVWRRVE